MNTYELGQPNVIIPKEVAICPECGLPIEVEVYEISQDDGGKWRVDGAGLHIFCSENDPMAGLTDHYRTPYIDWLPLEDAVVDFLNGAYEFVPGPKS